jgi:hypothetical protein
MAGTTIPALVRQRCIIAELMRLTVIALVPQGRAGVVVAHMLLIGTKNLGVGQR